MSSTKNTTAAPMSDLRIASLSLAAAMTMLLAILDQNIVTTAALPIIKDLDAAHGLRYLPWLVTAYTLAATAMLPIYGKASDVYGPKVVFLFSVGLFMVGSALCGIAQNMPELITFRAVQGLGGGGLMSVTLVIVALVSPPKQRAGYGGIGGGVAAFGLLLGPMVGGYLSQHVSWRWIFYVNLPLGILAWILVLIMLKLPRTSVGGRIDVFGSTLIAAAVCDLLLVTDWGGNRYPWSSPLIIGMIALGVLLAVAFGWNERRASAPLFPAPLLRDRVFQVASPLQVLVSFGFAGSMIYVVLYLEIARGVQPASAGLQLLPMAAGILVANTIAGFTIARTGRYRVFLVVGALLETLAMLLLTTLGVDSATLLVWLALFLIGGGIGLTLSIVLLAVQNSVPVQIVGIATTSTRFSQQLGASLGSAILGVVLNREFHAQLPATAQSIESGAITSLPEPLRSIAVDAFVTASHRVFLVAAIVLAAGFVFALFVPEKPLAPYIPQEPALTTTT